MILVWLSCQEYRKVLKYHQTRPSNTIKVGSCGHYVDVSHEVVEDRVRSLWSATRKLYLGKQGKTTIFAWTNRISAGCCLHGFTKMMYRKKGRSGIHKRTLLESVSCRQVSCDPTLFARRSTKWMGHLAGRGPHPSPLFWRRMGYHNPQYWMSRCEKVSYCAGVAGARLATNSVEPISPIVRVNLMVSPSALPV